ncbi:glycerate kinase [Gordonia terrae]|uniref:Glycerate kinase n=2 Tax=Gordonia terrae TaxID=2055 RepID=A0AAD0KFZ5_9ACTN|nr:glycerate kinase [Gordonia terrae]VTR07737.1 glycerate kinase [Clostridioides difficile]ANY24912.1 glycerate kinase [Gordonia terrae]AWO85661.1 glycerate kinase [Gordonia terrae]VTS60827.1 Glycerate kinase [Gordonia terrae]GAB43933.1 putative glycerate kinase [Gordonia terrae NBRC 100016]
MNRQVPAATPPAEASRAPTPWHVVVAPDSFKGSASAHEIAAAITTGWLQARPSDRLTVLPQADGGEGTLSAIASSTADSRWHVVGRPVCGPDRRPVEARWLELPGSVAVIELAESSGLPLMAHPAPTRATTRGLGQVIMAVLSTGARRIVVGLGGSASTDGGVGALLELGLRLYDDDDRPVHVVDALDLERVTRIDSTGLAALPPDGVEILTDTTATLCGPAGAAHTFGAQKGADQPTRRALDRALHHFGGVMADHFGISATQPGAGAAGGTGFGLLAWGATQAPGALRVNELTGLTAALPTADLVITGEGCYDRTSSTGKLVGTVLRHCAERGVRSLVVAGRFDARPPDLAVELSAVAGSAEAAMADPTAHAAAAVRGVATSVNEAKPIS